MHTPKLIEHLLCVSAWCHANGTQTCQHYYLKDVAGAGRGNNAYRLEFCSAAVLLEQGASSLVWVYIKILLLIVALYSRPERTSLGA